MRKLILLFSAVLFSTGLWALESGVKTIGVDVGYATLTEAFTTLNTNGIGTGGVTINVPAGYTESITSPLLLTATGTSLNPILFQKDGIGSNPIITRTDGGSLTTSTLGGQGDAVIIIQGSDYVTFDGINVATGNQGIEYGYYIRKASVTDGSKYVTIKNAAITMTKGTSQYVVGIYSSNNDAASLVSSASGITITSEDGRNESVVINGNTISNVHVGILLRGFAATTPFNFYDQNFVVGASGEGNTIQNFGGGSANTSYGVYMIYVNNLNVSYNTIDNTAGGGSAFTSTAYGIFTSTATSANITISNNNVSVSSAGTTTALYGISNAAGSTAASNTVIISNNSVTNCSYTSATSALFSAIVNSSSAADVNIYSNTVSGNTLSGTGTFTGIDGGGPTNLNMYENIVTNNQKTGASGSMFLTRGSTAIVSYYDNDVYDNGFTNSSGTSSVIIYGYYNFGSPTVENLYNNQIYNLYALGTNTGSSSILYGIHTNSTASAVKNIYNNQIYDLSALSGALFGISQALGTDVKIYNNNIYNLTNATNVTTTARVSGITIASGNCYVYNNFISRLYTPASAADDAIRGINITSLTSSSTVGIYFNTIYLDATSTGTNFGSTGLFHTYSATSTTGVLDMRNNIIINKSTANGTGLTVAFRRSAATNLDNYSSLSNNNLFFAGTPSASNLIFRDGANSDQTLADFKTRVSPRESASITENVAFVNTTTSPYDLTMASSLQTQCESGGQQITSPIAITNDFFQTIRALETGYAGTGTAPDIGAYEGEMLPQDLVPPIILFTALDNTPFTTARTLTASISDASGVPQSGIGLPVLYWKINSGTYSAVQGTYVSGNDYTFTLGTGVSSGDTVSYYIVAQDAIGNIGASSNAGVTAFTANPPACSPDPTNPSTYEIVGSISGTITVGTGGDYTTLTDTDGLFNAINTKAVIGSITVNIISDITEPGTVALNQWTEAGGSGFTLTIKPDAAVTRILSGNSATSIIKLNGADRVTIDGSFNGQGKYLVFENLNTNTSANAVIWIASASALNAATNNTIKNCIIRGNSTSTTLMGIFSGGTASISATTSALAPNISNTIQANIISKTQYGIFVRGVSVSNLETGLQIVENTIGSSASGDGFQHTGITVQFHQSALISSNEIQNQINSTVTSNSGGIILLDNKNTVVNANHIHNLKYTGSSTGKIIGIHSSSANFNTISNPSALIITNNVIYDLTSTANSTSWNTSGISNNGGYGDKYYFNTVHLIGQLSSGTGASACFFNGNGLTSTNADGIEVVNNIFSITGSSTVAASLYAHYTTRTSLTNCIYNNNSLYFSVAGSAVGYLGRFNSVNYSTLSTWQTATGQEGNSTELDPVFTSSTDLTPNNALLNSAGVHIPTVTVDYTGATRSNPPDIGAIEFTPAACPFPLALTATNITPFTADLGWTEQGSATTWNVQVHTPGNSPGNGTPVVSVTGTTSNPWTATGLSQYTNYEFFVQADCGSTESDWSGPFAFTTTIPALSGIYTIDKTQPTGGSNFNSFNSFTTALGLGGFGGPITVNVVAGTGPYVEQVTFATYATASSTNTLTINGNGETLEFLSTNTNERATLKFVGTDYVTVNGLIVKALGSTGTPTQYGYALWLLNSADYMTFTNCEFYANTNSTSSTFAAVIVANTTTVTTAGLAASNLTMTGNKLVGGYYSLVLNGPSASPFSDGNIITDNEFSEFYYYGVYTARQSNLQLLRNKIHRTTRDNISLGYMVYMTGNMSMCDISKNRIYNFAGNATTTSAAYGIYGTSMTAPTGEGVLISNNVIYGLSGMNGTQYGIYLGTTAIALVYHNSVSLDNTAHPGSSVVYCLYQTGVSAGIDVKNNIFSYTTNSTGTKYNMYFLSSTAVVSCDNNVLYRGATAGTNNTGYWASTAYNTLTNWQAANGGVFDQASVDDDPLFTLPLLTPQSAIVNNIGANVLTFVPEDIFGASRTATPDPGAIEFAPPTCLTPSGIGIANITAYTADLSWTGPVNASSWDIELGLSGFSPTGSPTISGVTSPYTYGGLLADTDYEFYVRAFCGGTDYSTWVGPYAFTTDVSCPHPTGLTLVSKTPFSATLGWTSSASSFAIEYGVAPYTFTGVYTQIVTNPATLSGLSPSTTYQYKVKAICAVADSSIWSATGTFRTDCDYPTITSTTPGSRCGTGTVNLSATASAGTINWYSSLTGGSSLGTGSSYTTPVINNTTSYYVAASSGSTTENAGKTTYNVTDNTSGSAWGLVFDVVNSEVVIQSVDVYSVGSGGSITVELRSNTGALLQTVGTYTYPAGSTSNPVTVTLPLNLTVPVGTGYRLVSGTMSGNLIREFSTNNNFPYTSASGNVSVTSGFITNPGSTTYYWFYNWQVTTGCESPRTEVIATVNTPPAINASATPAIICLGDESDLNVTSSNAGYSYEWTGGLIGANHVVSPTVSTTYSVTASDISGGAFDGCVTTASVSVTVNPVPTAVSVTPSSSYVGSITQLTATGGSISGDYDLGTAITTTSTTGITPFSSNYEGVRKQYLIRASELTALGITPGNINSLAFDVTASGVGTQPQRNFTMKIAHTSNNELTGAYGTPNGSWNIVYTNSSEPAPAVGWKTFTFASPFVWDGTSNVLIDICHENDNDGSCGICYSGNSTVRYTATTFNSVYGRYNDNLPACDINATSQTTTGLTNRPNMRFNASSPADITWSPTTDLYTDASATIPYTGGVTTTVYANPTAAITYTATATNSYGCTSMGTAEFLENEKTLNIVVLLEGLYNPATDVMRPAKDFVGGAYVDKFGANIADEVTIELYEATAPYNFVMDFTAYPNLDGALSITNVPGTLTGSYYIVVKHRSSIETWSGSPVDFTGAGPISYNFTTSASQAYGDNLKLKGTRYVIYGGNPISDDRVEASDMALVDNGVTNLLKGYTVEDVDGNGQVEAADIALVDNNLTALVLRKRPQ